MPHGIARNLGERRGNAVNSESTASQQEDQNPRNAAHDVVKHEMAVGHAAHAADERSECAHDRHEAGQNDGLASIALVKIVSPLEMFGVQKADSLSPENT